MSDEWTKDRCPKCGHIPKSFDDLKEWGGVDKPYHKEVFCLRRQLAQAQERAETAIDKRVLALNEKVKQARAMIAEERAHNARMRRVVEAGTRLLNAIEIAIDQGDVDETFTATLDDIAAREIIELRNALATLEWEEGNVSGDNPLAAYTDGQLYDELRRRGWVAATWTWKGGRG